MTLTIYGELISKPYLESVATQNVLDNLVILPGKFKFLSQQQALDLDYIGKPIMHWPGRFQEAGYCAMPIVIEV
jgi:hypothetical protein